MLLIKSTLQFIKRQLLAITLLVPYFLMWFACFFTIHSVTDRKEPHCGAVGAGLVVILLFTLLITLIVSLIFVFLISKSEGRKKKDNRLLLLLVIFPVVIGIVDFFT